MTSIQGKGIKPWYNVYPDSIGAFFNTDGISPFKSSRLTVWPIYLTFPSLPPSIRMNKANFVTCAFRVGQEKPSMEIFLKPLEQLLSQLRNTGITYTQPTTEKDKTTAALWSCRLQMMQFNGASGYPVCIHPGA